MTAAQQIVRRSIVAEMAGRYGMEPATFEATLRATVVPRNTSREEFAAFLMVAREYGLNPATKEIYAFPKKGGGIQPIVGVDGWANIINSHPQFDGMDFIDHHDAKGNVSSITCRIYRKDRTHPIEATEYLAECSQGSEPWKKWPRRMLRHKAMIQCARYAFGFAGIIDPDEYDRRPNREGDIIPSPSSLAQRLESIARGPKPPPEDDDDDKDAFPDEPEENETENDPEPNEDGTEAAEFSIDNETGELHAIDPNSPDYKRGAEDRAKGLTKCLNSSIRNDDARFAQWRAGYEAEG